VRAWKGSGLRKGPTDRLAPLSPYLALAPILFLLLLLLVAQLEGELIGDCE